MLKQKRKKEKTKRKKEIQETATNKIILATIYYKSLGEGACYITN